MSTANVFSSWLEKTVGGKTVGLIAAWCNKVTHVKHKSFRFVATNFLCCFPKFFAKMIPETRNGWYIYIVICDS